MSSNIVVAIRLHENDNTNHHNTHSPSTKSREKKNSFLPDMKTNDSYSKETSRSPMKNLVHN
ncbi:hypothetical protein BOTCAL_0033g00030 [Botryotinia calthae]|uniref:Uncharacterized protein n=1 Tax=Botryotinia calthae TaxID=38488 RepID=A0A4Y8DFM1_9HELO|nr:hypothetical protein BOTCAL_0033g00030 [Botryotinia calthae]